MTDVNPPDDVRTGDRRRFLKTAGVGTVAAGALWVVPSVLTAPAAAAASCVGNTGLTWSSFTAGTGAGVFATGSGSSLVNVTVGTVNTNGRGSSGGGGSLGNNFTVIDSTVGQQPAGSRAWYMQMNALSGNATVRAANWMETTFTFSKSVVGLTFSVFDVDRVDNNNNLLWKDIVAVSGNNSGTARNVTVTRAQNTANSPALSGSGTTTATATGDGNSNIDPSVNEGNVTFNFAQSVNSVTIRYSNTDSSYLASDPFQFVAIGNLTWSSCV